MFRGTYLLNRNKLETVFDTFPQIFLKRTFLDNPEM